MRAVSSLRALPLAFLVLAGCASDPFAPGQDAGADVIAGDAGDASDALDDRSGDAVVEATTSLCPSLSNALLCDDFERASVQGPWESVETLGNGELALIPGWSNKALRVTADGVGARAALMRTFSNVGSWSLWFDVDVAAASTSFSVIALVTAASETTALEVDGKVARLRSTAATQQLATLGSFSGVRSVVLLRDIGTNALVAKLDGKVATTLTVANGASGSVTVRVGIVDPGPSSVPAEARFDRVAFTP